MYFRSTWENHYGLRSGQNADVQADRRPHPTSLHARNPKGVLGRIRQSRLWWLWTKLSKRWEKQLGFRETVSTSLDDNIVDVCQDS